MPEKRDLYREAVQIGTEQWWNQMGEEVMGPMPVWEEPASLGPEIPEYWIARYAAREAVQVLLEKAKELGVTAEQWEALRAVAADIAYD